MLTSFADEEALMAAILAGASGYVLKRVKSTALVDNIRRVGHAESLLDPAMTERLFQRLRNGPKDDPLLSKLTNQFTASSPRVLITCRTRRTPALKNQR